jgi:F-type H+-transporting ATPase subunit b
VAVSPAVVDRAHLNEAMYWTRRSRKILLLVVGLLMAPGAASASEGLEIFPDFEQLAILIVLFTALVFPVNAWLIKPLLRVLEEREERIDGARDRAGRVTEQAEESLSRYRAAIDAAKADAEQQRRGIVEEARGEQTQLTRGAREVAEQQIEAARREVGSALEQARTSLRGDAEALARQAVERILGREVA